jgi:hypothetical protein
LPFVTFCDHLVYIFPFWYVVPRKIWQPYKENFFLHSICNAQKIASSIVFFECHCLDGCTVSFNSGMGSASLWQVVDLHNASFISSCSALRMYVHIENVRLVPTDCSTNYQRPGTDLMILKIFSPDNWQKIGIFDSKQSKLMQKFDRI